MKTSWNKCTILQRPIHQLCLQVPQNPTQDNVQRDHPPLLWGTPHVRLPYFGHNALRPHAEGAAPPEGAALSCICTCSWQNKITCFLYYGHPLKRPHCASPACLLRSGQLRVFFGRLVIQARDCFPIEQLLRAVMATQTPPTPGNRYSGTNWHIPSRRRPRWIGTRLKRHLGCVAYAYVHVAA